MVLGAELHTGYKCLIPRGKISVSSVVSLAQHEDWERDSFADVQKWRRHSFPKRLRNTFAQLGQCCGLKDLSDKSGFKLDGEPSS